MKYSDKPYSLLAYDKGHDVYDVICSGEYDDMVDLANILASILHSDRLLSKDHKEPYDWFEIYNNVDEDTLDII